MGSRLTGYLRTSARPYLIALVITLLLGTLGDYLHQYVWPSIPLVYGQAPDIYVSAAGVGIAGIFWVIYRGRPTHNPWLITFFALLVATWVLQSVLTRVHGDSVTYAVLLYVPVLIGVWWKTPPAVDVLRALLVLGWGIVVILIAVRLLELAGLISPIMVGPDLLSFEKANYWLPFSGTLGPEGRWHGPFGHAAKTGTEAAFLVVLAFGLRARSRWVFVAVGIVTLLLTASRGSVVAAAAGVLLIVVCGRNVLTKEGRRKWLLVVLGFASLVALAGMLIRNPNLTGRTTYWTIAFDLWRTSPITGVGSSGMQKSDLAIAGSNAHNILVDAAVKFGLVGTALVVGILLLTLVLAINAGRQGLVLPLGITGAYIVLGMSEADTEWMRMTLPWLWLILAAILAGRAVETKQRTANPLSSA